MKKVLLFIGLLGLAACSASTPGGGGGGTTGSGDVSTSPGTSSGSGGSGGSSGNSATGGESGGSTSAGNPGDSGGSTSAGNPGVPLTLNLTGAIGLAIDNSPVASALTVKDQTTGSSNLKRVNADNSLSDTVTSGSVTVQRFMVAAGNQIYLLLSTPVDSCILVRVDGVTNQATCVDPSISNLVWNTGNLYKHDPIQFDGNGAIYYLFHNTKDGTLVLRRNASGTITDLINENISVTDFLVLSDGTIFMTGETTATSARWVRKITPANSLQIIFASAEANFMFLFPDGNIYMGIWATPVFGVARYLTTENVLDDTEWITTDINQLHEPRYYDCETVSDKHDFTGWCGSYVTAVDRTTSGKVYVVAGDGAEGVLMQYYPTVAEAKTSVAKISVSKEVLTSLILAGLDSRNNNKLTLYDTNADTETDLLGSENIEVYHLNYLNSNNHQIVMFDGLRFSDNSYVLCQVDLTNNNTLTCSKTGVGKLTDFQLFTK